MLRQDGGRDYRKTESFLGGLGLNVCQKVVVEEAKSQRNFRSHLSVCLQVFSSSNCLVVSLSSF